MRVVRAVALGVCGLIATTPSAHAQTLGQVWGSVTNRHGVGLASVSVELSGSSLPQPIVISTTTSGAFEFPRVPAGVYTITCRLTGFKDSGRPQIQVRTGRTTTLDLTLEPAGGVPYTPVNAGQATTGETIDANLLLHVPTARDPWQIVKLAPAVVLSGVNVAGSSSDQQLTPSAFGSSLDVQWHVNGGTMTDMGANASPDYYNFDSLDSVQVVTGGSDVSVASAGLFINLVTRSGTNALVGSATTTLASSGLQSQNVSQAAFTESANAAGIRLTGNPLRQIDVSSGELGGPIRRDRIWFWAGADYQDFDVTTANFVDTTRGGCSPPPSSYAQLSALQACLADDKATIGNINGTLTSRLGPDNTLQFLYQTDQKVRNNRPAASAAVTPTDVASTQSQYSAAGALAANPVFQLTHTWHPANALIMENQLTNSQGGFFLDSHDYTRCGSSSYARDQAGQDPTDPTCGWNTQALTNLTTGVTTRAPSAESYQTARPSWEVKTDDHYLGGHFLGGSHALRFGAGWRKDPVLSYSHQGGGAQAFVACAEATSGCGPSIGANSGLVAVQAVLSRDGLVNYDWRTFNWYAQDSYTTHRLTITGGTRWDRQSSLYLGGCVSANSVVPLLLPRQCQSPVDPHLPFEAFSPRLAVTYDLTGDGRTTVHGSVGYYHQSKLVLANRFSNTGGVSLTSPWDDLNHDDVVEASEVGVQGVLESSTPFFSNGVLANPLPTIDPNLQLARTREGIAGVDREFWSAVHAAVNVIYRYDDLGATDAGASFENVADASALWQQHLFTDPTTGITAPYYTVCSGCETPFGGSSFTTTSLTHDTYLGVTTSLAKRLANRWQGEVSYTWNHSRVFTPVGTFATTGALGNPTGVEFTNGFTNGTPPQDFKAFGYFELPHGITAGLNVSVRSGNLRTLTINGPGEVPSGTSAISYTTLTFQDEGTSRTPTTSIVDLNIAKALSLGRSTLTITVDCFNVLNTAAPQGYVSDNASNNGTNGRPATFTGISAIVPPRVFRLDARFSF